MITKNQMRINQLKAVRLNFIFFYLVDCTEKSQKDSSFTLRFQSFTDPGGLTIIRSTSHCCSLSHKEQEERAGARRRDVFQRGRGQILIGGTAN